MERKVQRARIFIKNLPFTVTDNSIKEHYEKFGKIIEISILKKANGQLLGCGFVQFEAPHGALEAVSNTNEQMFLGRKISCQLATFKQRQDREVKKKAKIRVAIKNEITDIGEEESTEIMEEGESNMMKMGVAEKRQRTASMDEAKGYDITKPQIKKHKLSPYSNNDIDQGRTVFVKNVPFAATDDDIRSCFSEYGDLEYGLVVKDKFTEHSKGTAFVKFVNKEDADKCLKAGTELQIEGSILDCHIAMSKQDLERTAMKRLETAQNDLPVKKDMRRSKFPKNLHLLNEGAVLAGSLAAASVSSSDMQLRLSIAQQRQRRLKADSNLVISDRRLIVHNLPPDWTDRNLQAMCKQFGVTFSKNKGKGKKRKGNAKEAKVIRSRDAENSSKCFAYIGCETHEIALNLLRAVNNNPEAFGPPPTPHKRPIIYFSLEDRRILHKLDKRHRKEGENPNETTQNTTDKNTSNAPINNSTKSNQNQSNRKISNNETSEETLVTTVEKTEHPSSKSNPLKTRMKHNPRRQLQLHREQIKQRKHKQRLNKPMKEHKNHQRMAKQDVKSIGETMKLRKKGGADDDFSKIVAGYKSKLSAVSLTQTKKKWYE